MPQKKKKRIACMDFLFMFVYIHALNVQFKN